MDDILFRLLEKAYGGDISILSDPNVSRARSGGWTPLHALAIAGKIEILQHPDCAKVEDLWGRTPLYLLASKGLVKDSDLKKLFPWYKRKIEENISREEINEILSTPSSVRYILSED